MAYTFYLGRTALPVAPSSFKVNSKSRNKVVSLIDGSEISLLTAPGLSVIEFDVLLPRVKYPFSFYPSGFMPPEYYIAVIEKLKADRRPFRFICTRTSPSGSLLSDLNLEVSLEEYTVTESARDGGDITVKIKLRGYRGYKNTVSGEGEAVYSVYYTVKPGDSFWSIAKRHFGDGSRWREIWQINITEDNESGQLRPGQVIVLPGIS